MESNNKGDNIEKFRDELYRAINDKELLDEEVRALSKKLDLEIVNYYKRNGLKL